MIIDFHVHCFPIELAARAIPKLAKAGGVPAHLDGTVPALLQSMDKAGIDVSVVQHVATRPGQEAKINSWAAAIQSERIACFAALHPDSLDWQDQIQRIVDLGLLGVKLHPDYQGFFVDEKRVFPIYEALCRQGLPVLFHAGLDVQFQEPCHCPPKRLRKVVEQFPEGIWIAAHMGGYRRWEEVWEHLVGLPLYFDTSYSYHQLGAAGMNKLIKAHGPERILFGSDSPWADQQVAISEVRSLDMTNSEKQAVLGRNALRLLGGGLKTAEAGR